VRRVIVISRCGALHGTVKLGDWIFPKVCISDEGTSPHYLSASAASSLTIKGQFAQSLWQHIALCSVRCHKGSIVSTDSPLCLDHCRFISAGVLGVDMELAALVAVARMRKVSLASVLLVTDFARKGFPLFVTSGGISVELSRLRLLHSIIKLITETAQGQNESSCCPIE
jgi:purine-nucleoside phosphorylase